ncbi:MAG: hypothetical protein SD837_21965 [Candidatus Electrothrix scaldis]|nr:MAG: hypothetical protein SD837_21965 [Candidatus Electrothrix sp. GW3-3]
MRIKFSKLSGDAVRRFGHKCQNCVKGGKCRLRIRINRSLTSGTALFSESLSYSNTRDMDVLCSGYKESQRKGPEYYRKKRFIESQTMKEARGQLRLF